MVFFLILAFSEEVMKNYIGINVNRVGINYDFEMFLSIFI